MSKAVVYVLLATAFLLFIVFSQNNRQSHRSNPSLSRRLGYDVPLPTFDPLVTKIERLKEEKETGNLRSPTNSENKTFEGESGDAEDYFGYERKLNITLRLMVLFPFLDEAPKDGFVSFKELVNWNIQQAMDRLNYRTRNELVSHDNDRDGAITLREYLPQSSDQDIEKNGMLHGEAGWWKEQFINADADKNGSLSFNEFRDFLHPEDSNNQEIQKWLLREKIKRMDYDDDGKLNLEEFRERTYEIYKNYVEFESAGENVPTPEDIFDKLDVNKDKFLTVEELIPILRYLYPGELSYAKHYSSYLIHEADDNGDGRLTLDEMLNHEYIFYSTVYDDRNEDDDDDFIHDEL